MRLLTPQAALEMTALAYEHFMPRRDDAPLLFVWTDDNDAFAVFTSGSLVGMVAFVDHEESVPVPVYTSVEAFLGCLIRHVDEVEEWRDLPRELPRCSGAGETECRNRWLAAYAADPDDDYAGLVACQFLTPYDSSTVGQLLDARSQWVQERACQLAGQWQLEALTERLELVARRGLQNGRLAAILALQKLRNAEARHAVQRLRRDLGTQFAPYFG